MLESQDISSNLKEAMFRLSYIKKEAELQMMFKSSKRTIQRLKTGKFSLPKLTFLQNCQAEKLEDEPESPVSASSSISTNCSSAEGELTFNFEELSTITTFDSDLTSLKSSPSLKLIEEDSVTKVSKKIKKRHVVLHCTLNESKNQKRRMQMKLRMSKITVRTGSKSRPVRRVRQDSN